MSYTEDTKTVLEAMKYDYTEGPDSPEAWLGLDGWRVDANFVVERVIPWAAEKGIDIRIDGPVSSSSKPSWWARAATKDRGTFRADLPTMPEAVMAAIAAALRSNQ